MSTELLDLQGLAEWLHVSKSTAHRISRHFPRFTLGDRITRFDKAEVLAFLREERARQDQHASSTAGLHPRKLKAVS